MSILGILEKARYWYRGLVAALGVLLFMALLYTWMPAKIGCSVTYFDGLIELSDGAFYGNLAILLFLQTFSLVCVIAKHIWAVIRRKDKFNGRFVGVEFAFGVFFALLGLVFVRNDRVVELKMSTGSFLFLLLLFALVLFLYMKKGLGLFERTKTKSGAKAPPEASPVQSAPQRTMSAAESAAEFRRVVEEKNRLTRQGDYASQIPLLTKATELELAGSDKAKLWNYLGLAYERLSSPARSMECYRTALTFDANNPSSLSNLALLEVNERHYQTAMQYMDMALRESSKRGGIPSVFYTNYAYVAGMAGNKAVAQEYLKKAAECGCDAGEIATIRRRIGLS